MKKNCTQFFLLVLTLAYSKLIEARDDYFFQDEIIQPEFFSLASQTNLRENRILEDIGFKVREKRRKFN